MAGDTAWEHACDTDRQMLNKQEINSSFPHKRAACFCWTFACMQAVVQSQCVLSHLTLGREQPLAGQNVCPGCSWQLECLGVCDAEISAVH